MRGMSIPSSCKRVCVPQWSLNALQAFYVAQVPLHPPFLRFLYPRSAGQLTRRTRRYSSGRTLGQSGPSTGEDGDSANEAETKNRDQASGTDSIPQAGPGIQQTLLDRPSDVPEGSKSNEQQMMGQTQMRRKKWNPFTTDARQEMRELLNTLEDLANKDADAPAASSYADLQTNEPWVYGASRRPGLVGLPQSPIFKKKRKRDTPPKSIPNPALEPLSQDPWARMLAEPVRLCRGTGVRLPVSLLSDWGLTRHPESGEIYLMPTRLADLDSVERVSTRQELEWRKMNSAQHSDDDGFAPNDEHDGFDVIEDDIEDGQAPSLKDSSSEGELLSHPPSKSKSHSDSLRPALRLLLYDNLINLSTLFTLRKGKGSSAAGRFLPKHLIRESEQARQYERSRKTFETLTGTQDSTPSTDTATLDLSNVQWQNDIGLRILEILRKRVVIAFDRIVSRQRRKRLLRMSAVPMSRAVGMNCPASGMASQGLHDTTDATSTGQESDSPPSGSRVTNCEQSESTHPLPPKVYLHLGPLKSTSLDLLTDHARTIMVPPLVSSITEPRSQHFPVFPLRAMLGEKHYQDLLAPVRRYQYLRSDPLNSIDLDKEEYLLMLKHRAQTEHLEVFVRAIWRLWRWGGGRRWMNPDNEHDEGWKKIVAEVGAMLSKKSGVERGADPQEVAEELMKEVEEVTEGEATEELYVAGEGDVDSSEDRDWRERR